MIFRTDWEVLLQEVIGPTHVLFHSIHFGTLSLCIFLRRDLIWFCTGRRKLWPFDRFNVDIFVEPVEHIVKFRAVNPRRTKGSLIINFNLFGTSFMIMNSHFEGKKKVEKFFSNWKFLFSFLFSWSSTRRSFESTFKFSKYRHQTADSRFVELNSKIIRDDLDFF